MTAEKSTYRIDWDDARFFLAALRAGSYLGAARRLGVSHSTVKRRLQGLEDALDAKLFTATGDGVSPTDAALAALDAAEEIEQSVFRFGDRLLGESRELSGTLIVTTVDGMTGMLARTIRAYRKRHPKVGLVLSTNNRPLDLRRREADVAIRITNTPEENLFGRKVSECEYRPFASKTLIRRLGERYSELPWVMWDHSAGATETEAWFKKNVAGGNPAVRVTNITSMITLAAEDVGAAILPEFCGYEAGLAPIGEPIKGFQTDIWCLCHQDLRHSERARAFMEEAAKTLRIENSTYPRS